MGMNYFLDDESILKSVPKGEIYVARYIEENMGLKVGDKITVEIEGVSIRNSSIAEAFSSVPQMSLSEDLFSLNTQ